MNFDTFLAAYKAAALWSSTDDAGNPLDNSYTVHDFDPEASALMRHDCEAFCESYHTLWADDAQAGHNFWLTRNRHGAGFWDGNYPEPKATELTDAALAFGELTVYIGENGTLNVA